ncbi:MAG: hypothetical protein M1816_003931 [Peltula sp. TS41687]|nr:MAG: hypothetical protein M1816_003931 [Peltula sp. TS41687]
MSVVRFAQEVYQLIWTTSAFSNAPVIAAWPDDVIRAWFEDVKALRKEDACSRTIMAGQAAGDCTGFSLRFAAEVSRMIPLADPFIHNGKHGATRYHCPSDVFMLGDSTARKVFTLEDGEAFINKASKPHTWARSGETITLTEPNGRKRAFESVSQDEVAWRTNTIQFSSSTVVVMFR